MKRFWNWKSYQIAWQVEEKDSQSEMAVVLIHGFGACKEHWRFNQKDISSIAPCYALDLIGFGDSSQPNSQISYEQKTSNNMNNKNIHFTKDISLSKNNLYSFQKL